MDKLLTEEIRDTARRIATERLKSRAVEMDRERTLPWDLKTDAAESLLYASASNADSAPGFAAINGFKAKLIAAAGHRKSRIDVMKASVGDISGTPRSRR
jgi:hypothetical protein